MKYYTVYRNDTDEVVAFGTAKECADKRKMTVESFHSFVSNTRSGRTKTYSVIVEELEETSKPILQNKRS